MFKRWLLGVAMTAFLASATIAQAAPRHRVNQAITLATVRQSAGYPSPGSSAVYAGTVRSGLGRGAVVQTITITGHPSPATFRFRGTSTAFYSHGTTRSAFTGTGTLQPGGRFKLAGHGRYTGGTLYRHASTKYSFTGTAPQPPPAPACAVPAGWQVVASDAQVVVIEDQPSNPIQEYRYCNYARSALGFQLLVRNDRNPATTVSTVDGVALGYILYHSLDVFDSPTCGGDPNLGSSAVYGVDTTSGHTMRLFHGGGAITAAGLSPPGVGAWIVTSDGCGAVGDNGRGEILQSFSFRTGSVTTLDTGDPGETLFTASALGSLQVYQCAAGCPADKVVIAWTHDGTVRYEQAS
ncbi:MAG: hypothetical protein JO168_25215 [Solirubrobacterales bacterium]|nr:hypothetical protein [Alphaproteobacteria bacterium]MBV9197447.1 hypothetical protein [Solirubrobacterales bacterium]